MNSISIPRDVTGNLYLADCPIMTFNLHLMMPISSEITFQFHAGIPPKTMNVFKLASNETYYERDIV